MFPLSLSHSVPLPLLCAPSLSCAPSLPSSHSVPLPRPASPASIHPFPSSVVPLLPLIPPSSPMPHFPPFPSLSCPCSQAKLLLWSRRCCLMSAAGQLPPPLLSENHQAFLELVRRTLCGYLNKGYNLFSWNHHKYIHTTVC